MQEGLPVAIYSAVPRHWSRAVYSLIVPYHSLSYLAIRNLKYIQIRPVKLKNGCGPNPKSSITFESQHAMPCYFVFHLQIFPCRERNVCKVLVAFNFAGLLGCIMR